MDPLKSAAGLGLMVRSRIVGALLCLLTAGVVSVASQGVDMFTFHVTIDDSRWNDGTSILKTGATVPCIVAIEGVEGPEKRDCEIEVHGAYGSTLWPKQGFRIKFLNETEAPVVNFWATSEDPDPPALVRRVVLKASYADSTFVKEKLTMDLLREVGAYGPRMSYARFFVNDLFVGLYQLIERIDKEYLQRVGLGREGVLYKAVAHSQTWQNDWDLGLEVKYGDLAELGIPNMEDIRDVFDKIAATKGDGDKALAELAPVFNIQSFLYYSLILSFCGTIDGFTKNLYLFRNTEVPSSPFNLIAWDTDATMATGWHGDIFEWKVQATQGSSPAINDWLLSTPAYLHPYLLVMQELAQPGGILHEDSLLARLDKIVEDPAFLAAVQEDYGRWGDDKASRTQTVTDNLSFDYETFDGAVARLKTKISLHQSPFLEMLAETIETLETQHSDLSGLPLPSDLLAGAECVMGARTQDVVVNEVFPSHSAGAEWIELVNLGTQTVGLEGWYVSDEKKAEHQVDLTAFGELKAGETLVVDLHGETWGLGSEDGAFVMDNCGRLVSSMTWLDGTVPKDFTYGRCDVIGSSEAARVLYFPSKDDSNLAGCTGEIIDDGSSDGEDTSSDGGTSGSTNTMSPASAQPRPLGSLCLTLVITCLWGRIYSFS